MLEFDPARIEGMLGRYGGAGPRYTSYPTAPAWSERTIFWTPTER